MPDLDDEFPTSPAPRSAAPVEARDCDLPDKLADLLDAIGNSEDYRVRIFRADSSGRMAMVGTMKRVPDPDELGQRFGGGEYQLIAQWRTPGVTVGRPNKRTIEFYLGPEYTAAANEERLRVQGPGSAGLDLEKTLAIAERIASLRGGDGGGTVAVVGMMERIMDRMDRMQERTDDKFEKLLDRITEAQARPVDPLESWRNSMVLAKEMGLPVLGEKEEARAPWLEVAELVANNAGKFLEMLTEAQKSKVAQMRLLTNPMARKVMAQAPALKDPAKRAAMIATLEAKLGPEQTKQIVDAIDGKTEAPK